MLIPYRVKNPVRRFPFITLGIIGANVIVYASTTKDFQEIRSDVLETYGFALFTSPLINTIASAFLHANILHLVGNMFFLWLFGPSVEERLGIKRYLLLYFTTGFAGEILQGIMELFFYGTVRPTIGASGCILGVAGAYLYLFPWSKVCVFNCFPSRWCGEWEKDSWHGVWEVDAIWVIGLYILIDFAGGLFYGVAGIGGSVANFAHVGGGMAGIFLCWLFRAKRDTEELSEAKAVEADTRDLENMPLYALEIMLQEEVGDPELIRAAIKPAIKQGRRDIIDSAMAQAGHSLIDEDPLIVAYYLLEFGGNANIYKPAHLLHLAGLLKDLGNPDWAIKIYRLVANTWANEPEAETALYRCVLCLGNTYKDADGAKEAIRELVSRFPQGEMIPFAKALWKQLK
ncbi:MAG: rhomboid family intramembrane serine protease [Armatimonadetes bacterium]|nr:rhomboid family intramembrane serine protease [Armatimonadota bacterium]